jgi:Mrp family chromosome partitioning ATPase
MSKNKLDGFDGEKEQDPEDPNSLERFVSFAFALELLMRRKALVFASMLFFGLILYNFAMVEDSLKFQHANIEEAGVVYLLRGLIVEFFSSQSLLLGLVLGFWVGVVCNILLAFTPPRGVLSEAEVEFLFPSISVASIFRVLGKGRKGKLDYLLAKPNSRFAIDFDNLRMRLFPTQENHANAKVVGVVSAVPAEGKTTFSFGLTLAASRAEKRVLLVDADLRRGGLSSSIKQHLDKIESGFEVQSPWQISRLKGNNNNFYILALEGKVPNPSQLVWTQFAEMLDGLRSQFDVIVLDFPPRIVPDVAFAAKSIDSLVYILRWNYAPSHAHRRAFSDLKDDGLTIEMVVLNAINPRASREFDALGFYTGRYGYY